MEEVNLSFDFGDSGQGFGPTLEIKGMKDHPQGIWSSSSDAFGSHGPLDGLEFRLFFFGDPEAYYVITVIVVGLRLVYGFHVSFHWLSFVHDKDR